MMMAKSPSSVVFLLISVLLPTPTEGGSKNFFDLEPNATKGALGTDFVLIEAAAIHALETYSAIATIDENRELLESKDADGNVLTAALFKETDDSCLVGYRGGETDGGFRWVANIDMSKAYFRVRNQREKKCRVVQHYKTLYLNKGRNVQGKYKDYLNQRLEKCWENGKTVIFAGHDLGGALATLAALEYADQPHRTLWSVVFGSPPVFMPAQYNKNIATGLTNIGARNKHPCKHINPHTFVPFVNSEIRPVLPDSDGSIYYDFMTFLNVVLYGLMDDEPDISIDCLVQGANHTKQFLEDESIQGNLGSQFGQRYLLFSNDGAISNNPSYLNYLSDIIKPIQEFTGRRKTTRLINFGNQANQGVTFRMVIDPTMVTESGAAECVAPASHRMETYLEKIQQWRPPRQLLLGFANFQLCNVHSDCTIDAICAANSDTQLLICKGDSSDFRPVPRHSKKKRKNK